MGHKFVVLLQGEGREEAHVTVKRIKELSKRIRTIDESPVTLYLAVGFTFFSECLDLKEQAKNSEADNAVFYYVNRKFEEECGIPAKAILGRSVREVYPGYCAVTFQEVQLCDNLRCN
jgi:hypothetical protein